MKTLEELAEARAAEAYSKAFEVLYRVVVQAIRDFSNTVNVADIKGYISIEGVVTDALNAVLLRQVNIIEERKYPETHEEITNIRKHVISINKQRILTAINERLVNAAVEELKGA